MSERGLDVFRFTTGIACAALALVGAYELLMLLARALRWLAG